jgi:dienelactone hydrolase
MEFNDPDTAGQVSGNPNSFLRIAGSSHLALLLQGYAIMDEAAMPVIGDPETMNNTFIEQIVQSAHAAIDHAVALGVADPDRVAIGGHSYGAFMTANVLAHSHRFKAGIARSGAYNRTLTPFGFQSEERTIWQAPEVYAAMSPFNHADKVKDPLLLLHGFLDHAGSWSRVAARLSGHVVALDLRGVDEPHARDAVRDARGRERARDERLRSVGEQRDAEQRRARRIPSAAG